MKTVASGALGCKVNQYESEAIGELFEKRGYQVVGMEDTADIYIINTCTVTHLGDRKSRQWIRRAKRKNPDALIAVVGCYAQTAPDEVSAIEGVSLVIGTKDKSHIVDLVEAHEAGAKAEVHVTDIRKAKTFEPLSIERLSGRTRAYLKIQDGCSQFCTYCIIPYARGPIRSRPPQDVRAEVHRLAENGFREVVLTGIHVASYGKDLGEGSLISILEDVSQEKGIDRIRLSSIEPGIVTEAFAQRVAELPKVCAHFHLSLQSGCNKTLRAMHRRYTAEEYRQAVQRLQSAMPHVALTTDVIVGFPGETEEDFLESYAFVKEMGFSKLHVFPFSPKKGTPAAIMQDQVSAEEKNDRKQRLIALGHSLESAFLTRQMGTMQEVLFEQRISEGWYEGHTQQYLRVMAASDMDLTNRIFPVALENFQGERAAGRLILTEK